MEDLRQYITDKKSFVKKIKEESYNHVEIFYKLLGMCFKYPSRDFLTNLKRHVHEMITYDVIDDDFSFIAYLDQYIHFEDYNLHQNEMLSFLFNCLVPSCRIIKFISESNYFDDPNDVDNLDDIEGFEDYILCCFDNNEELPEQLKEDHKTWLTDIMKDYTRSGESITFATMVCTSPYIKQIHNDTQLEQMFSNIFNNFNIMLDEKTDTYYMYYGCIGYNGYEDIGPTINLDDLDIVEEYNRLLKKNFKLKYDKRKIVKEIRDQIKLSASCSYNISSRFIKNIEDSYLVDNEVMF